MKKLLLLFLIFAVSGVLTAKDVFLNDVKVSGMKNRKLENCTVVFDKEGNIRIKAPGVKVVAEEKKESVKYFVSVVIDAEERKQTLQIFVNGDVAGKIKPEEESSLLEITDFMKNEKNTVTLMSSPEKNKVSVKCIIGTGVEKDGKLELSPVEEFEKSFDKAGFSETTEIGPE
ncbi:MAG: hypothetical protein R6W70_05410 [bacterium]